MAFHAASATDCIHYYLCSCLEERDLDKTLACLLPDVLWIGIRADDIAQSRSELTEWLESKFRFCPQGFDVEVGDLRTRGAGNDALCSCLLNITSRRPGIIISLSSMRLTFWCRNTDEGWKIASMHASLPMMGSEAEIGYPVRHEAEANDSFEQRLGSKYMELLNRSLPGGIVGGYLEPGFPLYYINDRLLNFLGYSYEEFERAVDGLVVNLIHPDDRERVVREVEDSLIAEGEYEVRGRIRKSDGSWIWINNIGCRGLTDDGRPICFSVVSDISGEVEASLRLSAEVAEKESQTRRYDKLFMSALCGIVQYRILTDGVSVTFKNANLEAIRIFGYTPETFWAKDDWILCDLVADEDMERVGIEFSTLVNVGDKQNYEYRLRKKDGSPCWIIGTAEVMEDADGEVVVQSVFLDIDASHKAESRQQMLSAQVEAGNTLLRMALEHTSTCEFYYYPQEQRGVLPPHMSSLYHCRLSYDNMPASLAEDLVDAEWRFAYDELFQKILAGEKSAVAEFKARAGGVWCRITMSTVSWLESGEPSLVVGILEDITKAREMEFALEAARSRDRLTGLCNRESGVRMVRDYMERKSSEQVCTLMLLDLDNFRALNDGEGRTFGDAILQDVAQILLAETKPEDIQVRLGGDEFMLFVKDCDKAGAAVLGPRIADRIRELFVAEHGEFQVSASIGMCTTAVVDEYTGLYRCAESTLQYVKDHGKGKACCYLDSSDEIGIMLTRVYTGEHLFNEIKSSSNGPSDDLISFALELMGKAKRLDDSIALLLARIGQACGLDRVAIVEGCREYLSVSVSYQWARKRVDNWEEQTLFLSAEEYARLACTFGDEGVSFQNNHNGALASCMRIAIWNQGVCAGAIYFESRQADFSWPPELQKLLEELTKLISSFFMKARADSVSRAKTDFLSRMSHEIRTPMNAIAGMTAIAKSVLNDRERALECLEKIESANSYLIDLINDVLDMSRIESGRLELNQEDVDLGRQLDELLALTLPQALAGNIELTLLRDFRLERPVRVDMLRLNQVLINIIGNALKFTPAGGKVRLAVTREEESAEGVRLRFSVSDTGIGIAQSAIGKIFNAFEQADKSTSAKYGGTGLGLSISSRLVQMMGGALGVESEEGRGSEFFFTLLLPFSEKLAVPAAPEESPEASVDFRGLRLLLAEDNELNREIAETLLAMNGFEVESVADGRAAVEQFAAHEPGYYRGILMDIRMPIMDGLEAARHIRTLGRSDSRTIPIIALTANAFDDDSKKSLECGMNGHLTKPIVLETLLDTLRRCLF